MTSTQTSRLTRTSPLSEVIFVTLKNVKKLAGAIAHSLEENNTELKKAQEYLDLGNGALDELELAVNMRIQEIELI